ncbi:MAG: lysylphosphatidylglycerol synthase domain-containing protein, partial [Gaiellaceae bacterium]
MGCLARNPVTRILLLLAAAGVAVSFALKAHEAVTRLQEADPTKVAGASLLHLAMLVASALCWRRAFRALGGNLGSADACMRYGVGTFVNAFAPARAGGALRIGLFARTLTGSRSVHRSGTALLAIGSMRTGVTTALLAGAAASGLAPGWLLLAPVALVGIGVIMRARLPVLRQNLDARCVVTLWIWAALAALCRCGSIAMALAAVGIRSPVAVALVGLLGLELSGLLPLAPGLAGVGGAAVAVAITAYGVPSANAVAGGVAFYVAEAVAGIAFGAAATAGYLLTRGSPR